MIVLARIKPRLRRVAARQPVGEQHSRRPSTGFRRVNAEGHEHHVLSLLDELLAVVTRRTEPRVRPAFAGWSGSARDSRWWTNREMNVARNGRPSVVLPSTRVVTRGTRLVEGRVIVHHLLPVRQLAIGAGLEAERRFEVWKPGRRGELLGGERRNGGERAERCEEAEKTKRAVMSGCDRGVNGTFDRPRTQTPASAQRSARRLPVAPLVQEPVQPRDRRGRAPCARGRTRSPSRPWSRAAAPRGRGDASWLPMIHCGPSAGHSLLLQVPALLRAHRARAGSSAPPPPPANPRRRQSSRSVPVTAARCTAASGCNVPVRAE